MMPRKPPVSPGLLRRARELRNEPTEAEEELWGHLRRKQLGFRFRRQHPIGPFVVDFYCHEAKLAVELDGSQHLKSKLRDRQRAAGLKDHGVRLLRFWNAEVSGNLDGVLRSIRIALGKSEE